MLLALVGGLILNLMPCVFPVLGIKILGFVNQAGHERSKVIAHGLVFALGVLLSFWTLAGILAVLRAGGSQLGWGFQLQSAPFVFSLAAVMLAFAMNMSGVFEFGLSATSVGGSLQTKTGLAGSFFTGVLATIVAPPCSAPFLAPALGAALALSTVESFAIFTAIAVGLALPYLLLSIFPGAIKILPRPGAWMETFKQFMAFPLYATVGYLIWVLAGQTTDEGLQNVLFGLVLLALGVWVYGRWNAPGASAGRVRFGIAGLVVLAAAGLWLGWPQNAAAKTAAARPPAHPRSSGTNGVPRPSRNCAPRAASSTSTSPRAGARPARQTKNWCFTPTRCSRLSPPRKLPRCAATGPIRIPRSPLNSLNTTAAPCRSIRSGCRERRSRCSCRNY